jgi:hypothetical protein
MARWIAIAASVAALAIACGTNPPNRLVVIPFDAGPDAGEGASPDGSLLSGGDDGIASLGGPCVDDKECDDGIACTYDSCDTSKGRCSYVPDDTQCDDGVYCNGKEVCVSGHGCEAGPPVACDNSNPCTIATCVETSKSCSYVPRDVDQDGDPDAHCVPNRDCDDLDPNVSSLHAEVCGNGIDDNCNGLIDEMPCVVPKGDTCENALAISGAGTLALSSVGSRKTFATSCSVGTPQGAQDVVVAITVPPGPNRDLQVWATASVEVSVAIDGACGQPSSELACGNGTGTTSVRARARNVAPGTYYAVVTTQAPTAGIELKVDLLAPAPKATNIGCSTASPVQPGTPVAVELIESAPPLPSQCAAETTSLTYTFVLTNTQDVRLYASTVQGTASPVIGLRDAGCTAMADELNCRNDGQLYARALPPGTYFVTIGAPASIDATLELDLAPPSPTPPDQTCAAPPPVGANQRIAFDLSNHVDAIKDGCAPGRPDAAYDLSLASASDVLLIGRFPAGDNGAVALDSPACDVALPQNCQLGTTPVRLGRRNLIAGDYRAVVTDQLGLQGTLDALVRPTVAPTIIPPGGADTCAQAIDASAGGFFMGDTSTANADYSSGCDAPGVPGAGAADQVLALNLSAPQRVVLDMEGSSYTTILDVYRGPGCPGLPVDGGCYVGFDPQRSFLDMELPAGKYWLVVDGYDLARGAWDLDVRVLPP